jgi:hypothetical protein
MPVDRAFGAGVLKHATVRDLHTARAEAEDIELHAPRLRRHDLPFERVEMLGMGRQVDVATRALQDAGHRGGDRVPVSQ